MVENKKLVIMLPTYNEKENIKNIIETIFSQPLQNYNLAILVVDDNSPDGTGQIVEQLSKKHPNLHLMTRYEKRGRGSAGIAGLVKALAMGADYIVEMDADFSHDPQYLAALVNTCHQGADLALGSRFIKGGSDTDRNWLRQTITNLAGFYVRTILGIAVKDVSSGYRCFKASTLEKIDIKNAISSGPSIVLEILFKCVEKDLIIKESPIVFIDRKAGATKLNWKTLFETLWFVLKLKELSIKKQLFTVTN